jgi:vitamin B12 transporter
VATFQAFNLVLYRLIKPTNGAIIMKIYSFILLVFTVLFSQYIIAQADSLPSISIPEVVVSTCPGYLSPNEVPRSISIISPQEITNAASISLGEALEGVAGVDLRERGTFGIQSDLSIRGGSFEQTALIVNGVRWSAPHTAHHLMDVTFDVEDISRIEVLKGGSSPFLGTGALSGTVSIFTGPGRENKALVSIEAGSFGMLRIKSTVDFGSQNFRHRFALSRISTSGYIANTDASMVLASYSSRFIHEAGLFNFSISSASKAFGAQNFYTASYPTQYEETETLQSQLSWEQSYGNLKLHGALHIRNHNDMFELFRESDGFYENTADGFFVMNGDTAALYAPGASWYHGPNRHKSLTKGASGSALYDGLLGFTAFRFDIRDESIYSNVLGTLEGALEGDTVLTKGDSRTTNEFALSHRFSAGRFATTVTGAITNGVFGTFVLPGATLTMRLEEEGSALLFGSANRSMRQPSFTDLYYNIGGAQGSIDLQPEWSDNFETGVRAALDINEKLALSFEQALFVRQGHNLIDWVRLSGEATTRATNIREVTFTGMETSLKLKGVSENYIAVDFTTMKASESSSGFESNYVLDFLKHQLNVRALIALPGEINLTLRYSLQDREGGYYNPVDEIEEEFVPLCLFGANISKSFLDGKLNTNLRVDNVLNIEIHDIGNVLLPGRMIRGGLTFAFD